MAIPTPRPNSHDEYLINLAMRNLAIDVMKWDDYKFSENEEDDEDEIDKVAGHLTKSYDDDGYTFAKNLDHNECYSVDTALVEILENASHTVYEIVNKANEDWVTAYQIKPTRAIGDTVKFYNNRKKDIVEGVISKIDAKVAKYHVFCESLGHVKKGCGTHATIVNYEDIL